MANSRVFILSSDLFDATTDFEVEWLPKNDAKQPRSSATQAAVGRLNFKSLLRPGSVCAIVWLRSLEPVGIVATIRSGSADEIAKVPFPDAPAPLVTDSPLTSLQLTTEWSRLLLLGPTDAISLSGPRGTVELVVQEASGAELLAYWNAVAMQQPPAPTPIQALAIEVDTTLSPWVGDLYVRFEPQTDGVMLSLPQVGAMSAPARLHVARTGGRWGGLSPFPGETVNGASGVTILGGFEELLIEVFPGGWASTKPPVAPSAFAANNVAGGTFFLPVVYGKKAFDVDFTEQGFLQLPPSSQVAEGTQYHLVRVGDSFSVPARCQLHVSPGELMDGELNGVRYLDTTGASMIITRMAVGWSTTSNRANVEPQVVIVAGNTPYAFGSGWVDTKYLRATGMGAKTITLPPAALTPNGCRLVLSVEGPGPATVGGDADIIFAGSSLASVVVAQNWGVVLEFNGTKWIQV